MTETTQGGDHANSRRHRTSRDAHELGASRRKLRYHLLRASDHLRRAERVIADLEPAACRKLNRLLRELDRLRKDCL